MGSMGSYGARVVLLRNSLPKETNLKCSETLLSVWSDIYWYENEEDGDNDEVEYMVITREFIDSLKPGDILQLEGEGSC